MLFFLRKRYPEIFSWIVSILVIIFAIVSHIGLVDNLRGLGYAKAVAQSYDLSYGPDGPQPIYPGSPAWPVMLRLIHEYSKVDISPERTPLVIARARALADAVDINIASLPQWTAPGTPIYLLYKPWPAPGTPPITSQDYRLVGSINDLHDWIRQDADDFHFLISDVLFAVLSLSLAIMTTLNSSSAGRPRR